MNEVTEEIVKKSKGSGVEIKTPILNRKVKEKITDENGKIKIVEKEEVIPTEEKKVDQPTDGRVIEFEMGATINTGQYENIQPKIKLAVSSLEKGTDIAMSYIGDLTRRFSISGGIREKTEVTAKLKSINEKDIEVDFDAVGHNYNYLGKKLVGATTFIQRFYKKFDQQAIAKVCAKSWEVEQQTIEDMWGSNGDIASNLGTLVDNALEHYNKYYDVGEKIKAKNGKENPAMPKHPIVKNIIEEFHKLPHTEGQMIHQAFITDVEGGYCGQIDRLIITGEKKCIIQDFKVQIDSNKEDKNNKALAPFDILPPTKLTKYALQVNFYRQILEKSGWEVEKMEAVVYEDKWVIYPLEKIEVIK